MWFCAYMRGKVYEITACGIDMKTGLLTKFKKYENIYTLTKYSIQDFISFHTKNKCEQYLLRCKPPFSHLAREKNKLERH